MVHRKNSGPEVRGGLTAAALSSNTSKGVALYNGYPSRVGNEIHNYKNERVRIYKVK